MTDNPNEVMMKMLDAVTPMFDAITGLRRKLEADGWTQEAAEQMAMAVFIKGLTS